MKSWIITTRIVTITWNRIKMDITRNRLNHVNKRNNENNTIDY